MIIWTMAVLLFALFGALGYFKGAIRTLFAFLGLVLGVFLALPLAPVVKPLVPLVGLKNPIWSILLPPVIVFFLIAIILVAVGFVAHWKLNLLIKYRTDDYHRLAWERLNKRLGVSLGLVAGASYTILIGLVVYIVGYLTVQVSAGDGESKVVRYLNQARVDLRSSGLEQVVAIFDPTPESYYSASDILGLLYHNRLLSGRLAGYPAVLSLADRQEFQDVSNDPDYQTMLNSQSSLKQIIENPKTQAILNNKEIIQQIKQIDLKDLLAYLKTGESSKYEDLGLLGRWQLDAYGTLIQEKHRRATITAAEMRRMRQQLDFIKGYTLVAMPDNNSVALKGPDVTQLIQRFMTGSAGRPGRPNPRQRTPGPISGRGPGPQGMSSPRNLVERSLGPQGAGPQGGVPQAPNVNPEQAGAVPSSPTALADEIVALPTMVLAQGTWSGEGDHYEVSLQAQAGGFRFAGRRRSAKVEATIKENRLYLDDGEQTMVFAKY
jgi:Colicin V production protein